MKNKNGFTFIEVLTAIMIVTAVLAIIYPLLSQLNSEHFRSSESFQALLIAQTILEQIKQRERAVSEDTFTLIRDGKKYDVSIISQPHDVTTVRLEVNVVWEGIRNERESVYLTRLFALYGK